MNAQEIFSRYNLDSGLKAIHEEKKLTKEQEAQIEALENALNEADEAKNIVLARMKKDDKLSESERILLKAQIEAQHIEKTGEIESKIKAINPSWVKRSALMIGAAAEKAGEASEAGSEGLGKVIGTSLTPAIKIFKAFGKGFRESLK